MVVLLIVVVVIVVVVLVVVIVAFVVVVAVLCSVHAAPPVVTLQLFWCFPLGATGHWHCGILAVENSCPPAQG